MVPIPIWLIRREVRTPEGRLCVDKGKVGDPQPRRVARRNQP